ncbi:MAG: YveK family protein [Anaerolineae bacterium]
MELKEYFRILGRRGWIIILCMVIVAASAFVFSRIQRPVYRSTVYLNVVPARLDYGLQQVVRGVMRNYAGTISSRPNAQEVIDRLQLDITPEQFLSKITVSPNEADLVLQINADDFDPLIARDIAQTSAEVFTEQIDKYMLDQDKQDRVSVTIRDYALPGTLHKPKWKINVVAGAGFGVIIGVAIVFILEWLASEIIRRPEDIERQMDLAVLGVIPQQGRPAARGERSLP